MKNIGVRQLRQHTSLYLRQVQAGRTLCVTDRGHPVALLTPLPTGGVLDRLAQEGRLQLPQSETSNIPPPLLASSGVPLPSLILASLREQGR